MAPMQKSAWAPRPAAPPLRVGLGGSFTSSETLTYL